VGILPEKRLDDLAFLYGLFTSYWKLVQVYTEVIQFFEFLFIYFFQTAGLRCCSAIREYFPSQQYPFRISKFWGRNLCVL